MKQPEKRLLRWLLFVTVAFMVASATVFAEDTKDTEKKPSSYAPVNIKEDFASTMARMKAEKTGVIQRQLDLLNERYDLSNRPAQGVVMSRGKAVQEGRDLTRFDLDYDLPDHFLPEFPTPIYLTTRTDLGDVSQGKVVTIKTFPLRGIKDSPPYLHDDRLLTLEDTVEFFNLLLQTGLNEQEKKEIVVFMRVL